MQNIPTVNFRQHQSGALSPEIYQQLAGACEDHGFFLLSGHGLDPLIDSVFTAAEAFFARPRADKMALLRNAENPFGYYDRELTKQKRDQKEVFDFSAGGYQSANPARQARWPSMQAWPTQADSFRTTLTEFFTAFTRLSEQTMRMVLQALGMPNDEIDRTMAAGFGEQHSSTARLNYYPSQDPVTADQRAQLTPLGDMALHHHTDPGAITLLLQDDHGGLQAESAQHGWIDVPPQAGTIVVNVGDVLQVWSNDRCRAGVHRVVPIRSKRGRFSVPFFFQPRHDAVIRPWVEAGESPRYQSFSWREFIRGRVSDNFADYGEQYIQIARYRV